MSIYSDSSFIISAAGGYKEGGGSAGRLYNLKPDGATYPAMDVTGGGNAVSQRSDGYYQINWPANTPRFSWNDGVPSILVESQRQNLITYPRSFDNAYWTKAGATVDDNAGTGYACPFVDSSGVNTLEGFKLVEDINDSIHDMYFDTVSVIDNIYVFSVLAKKGERGWIQLIARDGQRCHFNLENGTLGYSMSAAGIITDTIDGYYKCSITFTSLRTNERCYIRVAKEDEGYSYQGDGTSGIYICHAQLEQAASASSPIYGAEGSVLTRLADLISKTNASALIGQTEGTIFVDFTITKIIPGERTIIDLFTSGTTLTQIIITNQSRLGLIMKNNNVIEAQFTTPSALPVGNYRAAFAYKQNDFVGYLNGVKVGEDFTGNISNLSSVRLNLGFYSTGGIFFNDLINEALIFKTRLPNATLQALTTL